MSRRRAPVPDVDGPNLDQEWAQEWDEVVDIVCVGVGTVALAVGVAAERVGLDVLVTDSAGTRASVLTGDAGAYLAQLLDDIVVPEQPGTELALRRRGDRHWPEPAAGVLFSGPALRDWAGACLASPLGLLSTEVAGAGAVAIPVAAVPVGAPVDVDEWVAELARDCGLAARAGTVLRDLVFIEGRVAGVVLGTPGGEIVVRAAVGVVSAPAATAGGSEVVKMKPDAKLRMKSQIVADAAT